MDSITTEYVSTELGTVQIAPEVLEVIAGLAAIEIEGVAGMSGGIAGGIAQLLGRKNLSKGVKVVLADEEAKIDLSMIVEYGYRIPDLSEQISRNVKHAIESMTGITVSEVNIHIHDVRFKQADKPVEEDSAATGSRVK